jgi:hypothetical protein
MDKKASFFIKLIVIDTLEDCSTFWCGPLGPAISITISESESHVAVKGFLQGAYSLAALPTTWENEGTLRIWSCDCVC